MQLENNPSHEKGEETSDIDREMVLYTVPIIGGGGGGGGGGVGARK